jgi:methionine-rich copper-binding protein CopC
MKRVFVSLLALGLFIGGASLAEAHAFLDHAEPRVGSTVEGSPSVVKIWFTDGLQASVSRIQVFDGNGQEVDKGDVKIDPVDKSIMWVSVPKLPIGSYKVVWNAVCPLGHHTAGSFMFEVKSS